MEFLIGINLASLIQAVGLLGLFVIIFAESGLLIGFFLPGDSLLFTAGFLASQGFASLWVLVAGCFAAAVLGDNVGYAFGYRVGSRIFRREQSLFFNPKNLSRAKRFYEEFGGLAIVLARFLPAIRTFAPILAGVGVMAYPKFVFYNVIGAGLWAVGMPLAGFYLGTLIPGVDRYLLPIVLAIITLSMLPAAIAFLRDRERRTFVIRYCRACVVHSQFVRRTIGALLVIFGLVALVIPFFPFAWVAFIGLELLGLRALFLEKIRSWRRKKSQAA